MHLRGAEVSRNSSWATLPWGGGIRWGVMVPVVLTVGVIGAAMIVVMSMAHADREAQQRQRQEQMNHALDAAQWMLADEARDLTQTVSRIAQDPVLAAVLLSGSNGELKSYVDGQVSGGALDVLRVLTPGMAVATSSPRSFDEPIPQACNRSQVAGTLVSSPAAPGLVMVMTRDLVTPAGIPLRVCGGVDLHAPRFARQLRQVAGANVVISGVLPAPVVTSPASSETTTRSVRIFAGDPLWLTVSGLGSSNDVFTQAASPRWYAWPLLAALACLIALWCWLARRAERESVQGICRTVSDAVIVLDVRDRIEEVNSPALELLRSDRAAVIGSWLPEVFDLRHQQNGSSMFPGVVRSIHSGVRAQRFLCSLHRKDAPAVNVSVTARWLGSSGRGVMVISSDASAQSAENSSAGSRDPFTGVLTAQGFHARLEKAIAMCQSDGEVCSILQVDINAVERAAVPSSANGDQRLAMELIGILNASLRTSDLLAQLDVRCFAVLLPGCGMNDALAVAESLRSKVRQFRFVDAGRIHEPAVSIGAVEVGRGLFDVDAVLRAVKEASDLAKERGQNQVCVHPSAGRTDGLNLADEDWLPRIQHALEEDLFELFAQPVIPVSSANNGCAQLEVLLRMRADDGSFLSPAAFLPVAERQSLAEQLDARVIDLLFTRYRDLLVGDACLDGAGRALNVTVNVSAASVANADFVDELEEKMRDARVARGRLGFEVTETTAVSDPVASRRFFERMRALGCPVILDDFGNDAASLGRLRSMAVDFVKLDVLLLRDVVNDPVDRAMLRALREVASSLDIRVVAHYVQHPKVLWALRELGIDYVQGFAIGAPRPLTGWVKAHDTKQASVSPRSGPALALLQGGREA